MPDPLTNSSPAEALLPPLPPDPGISDNHLREIQDIEPDSDGTIPWWKPDWPDIWKQIGWGCIFTTSALLLVLLACLWLLLHWWGLRVTGLLFELAKLIFAVAVVACLGIGVAVKQIVAHRNDPFCIHCGYSLCGLPDQHICPECGRPYSFRLIRAYRDNRDDFILRWRQLRAKSSYSPPRRDSTIGPQ